MTVKKQKTKNRKEINLKKYMINLIETLTFRLNN